MRPRPALPALATALALLVLLLAATLVPLSVLARQNVASNAGQAVSYLAIGATGVVVARRQPRNPIGWLLLAIPVGMLLNKDSQCYAWLAYRSGQRLPFGSAALLLNFAWIVLFVAFPLVVLLFPDGRLPSPGWRWAMWAYLAAVASLPASGYAATVSVIRAHDVRVDSTGGLAAVDDPSGRTAWLSIVLPLVIPVLVAFWVVFAGRLILTWRRAARRPGVAGQERRQQLKWLMSGSLAALGAGAVDNIISVLDPHESAAVQAITGLLNDVGLAAFAMCVGVAIMRYRLYEIDRIISRTLAYAIITGLLVGVYAGLVLLATQVLRLHRLWSQPTSRCGSATETRTDRLLPVAAQGPALRADVTRSPSGGNCPQHPIGIKRIGHRQGQGSWTGAFPVAKLDSHRPRAIRG